MNRTVLVLGAVRDEMPLVRAFQKRGYKVVVAGKGSQYPCCAIAELFYDVDLKDKETLLEIARKERVCAVATNIVSIAVSSAAWLAQQLDLPGIGYEVAMRFTNKFEMRRIAGAAGVGCPAYAAVTSLEDALEFAAKHGYPLVMKPVDGNSSRGVFKVDSDRDVIGNFAECMGEALADKQVLVEGFVDGREYIVDGFSSNGVCYNTDVAYKEHFKAGDKFISKAVVIQDADHCTTDIERRLLSAHKKTVEALGLPFGPTHGEYIYCEDDDRVYLVEVAARGGGIRLSSDMIPLATGLPINDYVAECSLGIDPLRGKAPRLRKGSAAWFAFQLPEGTVSSIAGVPECLGREDVAFFDLDGLEIGAKTRLLKDDGGKYGPLVAFGQTRDDCYKTREAVKNLFDVSVNGRSGCAQW